MSQIITPPPLNPGDRIGVFAPSSWVEKEDIEKSATLMQKLGYEIFIHPQTWERENQSAGTHLQKALAFQGLWQRPDIKTIWTAGGGNRCLHLLDTINFKKLKNNPKQLIGFSDVTALLNTVTAQTSITTYHGPVFKNLHKYKGFNTLQTLLSNQPVTCPYTKTNILKPGKAQGRLFGGNLSLFQYVTGSHLKNAVIFLEDCSEELSRIDRMLCHIKRSGIFKNAAALLFGQFTDIKDSTKPFGYTLKDILLEHTEDLSIPVLYDMPFGHGKPLHPFPIGGKAKIDTENFKLSF